MIDRGIGWKAFENVKFAFLAFKLLKVVWASSLTFASIVALLANVPVAQIYLHSVVSATQSSALSTGQTQTYRPRLPMPREIMSDSRAQGL